MIPEVHLLNLLKSLTAQLAADLKTNQGDQNRTLLGDIFPPGSRIDDFDYYQAAAELLAIGPKRPGALRLSLGFTLDPNQVPAGHLMMPAEGTGGVPQGVGLDEQWREPGEQDEEWAEAMGPGSTPQPADDETSAPPDARPLATLARSYQSTYNLMLVAGSSVEASMLYHLFQGLLLAAHPILEAAGFQNLSLAGSEIRLEEEQQAPATLFSRIVSLTFFHQRRVRALHQPAHGQGFIFNSHPLT